MYYGVGISAASLCAFKRRAREMQALVGHTKIPFKIRELEMIRRIQRKAYNRTDSHIEGLGAA